MQNLQCKLSSKQSDGTKIQQINKTKIPNVALYQKVIICSKSCVAAVARVDRILLHSCEPLSLTIRPCKHIDLWLDALEGSKLCPLKHFPLRPLSYDLFDNVA